MFYFQLLRENVLCVGYRLFCVDLSRPALPHNLETASWNRRSYFYGMPSFDLHATIDWRHGAFLGSARWHGILTLRSTEGNHEE
jgi:hypothetical protein